jgi:ribosomal-protein-alanine N-acetyltransferase
MTPADLDAVLEIEQISFVRPWSRKGFELELAKPFGLPIVAEIQDRIAGYVIAWLILDELHIANVAVHPDSRRQGLAERLIRTVLAHDPRIRWAGLEVRRNNSSARAMYKKLGFEETGVRKNYYEEEGEDAILMTLRLEKEGDG